MRGLSCSKTAVAPGGHTSPRRIVATVRAEVPLSAAHSGPPEPGVFGGKSRESRSTTKPCALRACDLVPGRVYLSPTGRKCLLLAPASNGLANTEYLFAYLMPSGRAYLHDGFALNTGNAVAIAAMREVRA